MISRSGFLISPSSLQSADNSSHSLSVWEIKARTLESCLLLESQSKLSRVDNYQSILNAIAIDIRSKHRMRITRQKELAGMLTTLDQLGAKADMFKEQISAYNDYIEGALKATHKKGSVYNVFPACDSS